MKLRYSVNDRCQYLQGGVYWRVANGMIPEKSGLKEIILIIFVVNLEIGNPIQ